jgi:hypothetical protein
VYADLRIRKFLGHLGKHLLGVGSVDFRLFQSTMVGAAWSLLALGYTAGSVL